MRSTTALSLTLVALGLVAVGCQSGAQPWSNPEQQGVADSAASRAPAWVVAQGAESWRPLHAAGALDLGAVADRVEHSLEVGGLGRGEVRSGAYDAVLGESELLLRPAGSTSAALSIRTHRVGRGHHSLYDARGAPETPVAIVGNTAQLLLDARTGLVEHREARSDGVHLAWLVREPPPGDGALEVELRVLGLEPSRAHTGEVILSDAEGSPRARFGRAEAVGAQGRRWSLETEVEGDRLRLGVPAAVLAEAAWPLVIDPLVGPEISIDQPMSAPAGGGQRKPAVAENGTRRPSGGTQSRGSGGIRGARVRMGDGRVVDMSGINISEGAGRRLNPAVASDGEDFLVVWEDERAFSASKMDIYGARVRGVDGLVRDPEGFVVTESAESQTSPAVGHDGESYVIAWLDRRNGQETDIYARKLAAAGGDSVRRGGEEDLCTAVGNQGEVAVACETRVCLALWHDERDSQSAGREVYGVRLRPGSDLATEVSAEIRVASEDKSRSALP